MKCSRGKILRKGYTTKRGVRVSPSCVPDKGRPGKGPKTLPTPKRGSLRGWRRGDPAAKRRKSITSRARREGCGTVIQKLNLLRNITADAGTKRAAVSDMDWLRKQKVCRVSKLGAEVLIELGRTAMEGR